MHYYIVGSICKAPLAATASSFRKKLIIELLSSSLKFHMAKVHPKTVPPPTVVHPSNSNSRRETFTIWMKSLVMHGNGYTVFNSDGEIVYRIDNYGKKCSSQVHLMDLHGKVLFTILRRKLRVFGRWEGYQYRCGGTGTTAGSKLGKQKPCFQVRKHWRVRSSSSSSSSSCEVRVESDSSCYSYYRIEGFSGKSTFIRIVDCSQGAVVAEVKRKQTSSGVVLGDDVLDLVVEPLVDHSLVMALVAVCGLIHHRM